MRVVGIATFVLIGIYAAALNSPLATNIAYQLSTWHSDKEGVTLNYLGVAPVIHCSRLGFVPNLADAHLKRMCLDSIGVTSDG